MNGVFKVFVIMKKVKDMKKSKIKIFYNIQTFVTHNSIIHMLQIVLHEAALLFTHNHNDMLKYN